MLALLLALFIHGHHYGWRHHHQPPCSVVFHVGCASVNPPPHIIVPPAPVLPR